MSEQTTIQINLSTEAAILLCKAAIDQAKLLNINISVNVVDASGVTLASARMNSSPLISPDVAFKKAFTSISFKRPSIEWQSILDKKTNVLMGLQSEPNFTFLGGGLPITVNGKFVGAIGVSGGSEQQDIVCAEHALHFLNNN